MRTKTLLLIAALSAAGAATSMAQVFSVNAVGYVNTTVPAGKLALISNPLNAADNSINALFTDAAKAAGGMQVFEFSPTTGYKTFTWDPDFVAFDPDGTDKVNPGQGVFVKNPTAAALTITFVGDVPQGSLSTPLVKGLQIVASQVPQEGAVDTLGFVPSGADQIYNFDSATGYKSASYDTDFQSWDPATPTLKVGEAVFLRSANGGSWARTFSVNQ
jgi:hypothetical protein